MTDKFIQIHFLTSYPAALLNRDDAGFAKRIPFGGSERLRISSQCLKRHWRVFDGNFGLKSLNVPGSIRSRKTFEEYIRKPLLADSPDNAFVNPVVEGLMAEILGESKKSVAKKSKEEPSAEEATTSQLTVLGRPEVDYLLTIAKEVCQKATSAENARKEIKERIKEIKSNLTSMKMGAGLDAALFGRMVTSDVLARGDASVHVAHAITVHEETSESDYFAALDDLSGSEGEEKAMGSAHINSVELTSGLYYGYVVVDVPLLVSNLEGCKVSEWEKADKELAAKVVKQLIHLVAKVSPGAKLGSTAPYSYASMILIESGNDQPRTLANAFLKPVKQTPDLLENAYDALSDYISQTRKMYGNANSIIVSAVGNIDLFKSVVEQDKLGVPLDTAADWVSNKVRNNA